MIRLNEQWSLDKDDHNWILVEHYSITKDDIEIPKTRRRGYFTYPEQAVRDALTHTLKDAKSLRDAEAMFERFRSEIRACGRALAQNAGPYVQELKEERTARKRLQTRLQRLETA